MMMFCAMVVNAQKTVILEHAGTSTAFNGASPFVEAYDAAVTGDIIYLPGGAIVPPPAIDKGIKVYGVGHYPAATSATQGTQLTTSIYLNENADNFYLEGVEIEGNIYINSNQTVDHISIVRCRFSQFYVYTNTGTLSDNFIIRESVIESSINLSGAMNGTITNCILQNGISNGTKMSIRNNLFLYDGSTSSEPVSNVDNSTIANCIFCKDDYGIQEKCDVTTFTNNAFRIDPTPIQGNTTIVNSYINNVNLFENQSGIAFSYDHDYQLTGSYATDYLGDEGTQIGIYGGLFPFKEKSIPTTPHISSQTIAPSTDGEGKLSISITVEAQNN